MARRHLHVLVFWGGMRRLTPNSGHYQRRSKFCRLRRFLQHCTIDCADLCTLVVLIFG